MSNEQPLVVLGLQAENVKRVKAIEIRPPRTGVVEIAGRNGAGKSSALDAILYALGGKKVQPDMPVRKGEKSAKVVLELEDLVITRTWTEKDSYITVEQLVDVKGERMRVKVGSPQAFLDRIVGAGLGFDPSNFDRLKETEKAELLLSFLQLPEDPRKIDLERAALATRRAEVNREVRRLQGVLASTPDVEAPAEEISVAALAGKLDDLRAIERSNDTERAKVPVLEQGVLALRRRVSSVEAAISELEEQLAGRRRELGEMSAHLERHAADLEAARLRLDELPDPAGDIAAVQEQLSTVEATNAAVRQKKARASTAVELAAVETRSAELTEEIVGVDDRKAKMIGAAPFPIPGLGFVDVNGSYVVTFEGVPLSQASSALRMRIGLAIAMALNPTVRVVLLREGSLLDDDARAEVERVATERGFQVWLEVVGKGNDKGFVIEDGGVVKVPA